MIPEHLRELQTRVTYKGKGNKKDPNLYRGIVLKNNTMKILTKLITKRSTQEEDNINPHEPQKVQLP